MVWDETTKETKSIAPQTKQPNFISDTEFEKWLFTTAEKDKIVCLLYGEDGTGKSPIPLSYLSEEDIKNGMCAVIIDLDGGCIPLVTRYYSDQCKKYDRNPNEVFIVRNPLVLTAKDGEECIDYKETMNRIRRMIRYVKDNWEKKKIKFIVFDGLSTALKHAEQQMRLDKHLNADGGVQLRFWLVRNKIFTETLEMIKSLPISSFFIGHTDFILKGDETDSSVKIKTNAMVHQKIRCVKERNLDKSVILKAIIEKSKYNVRLEGRELIFCTVKPDGSYEWDGNKVLKEMI